MSLLTDQDRENTSVHALFSLADQDGALSSFAIQDQGTAHIGADGQTLIQESQSWKQLFGDYTITANTRLQFNFSAATEGEIHGIMFANGTELNRDTTIQIHGTQRFGAWVDDSYTASGGVQSFDIAVGALFTGTFDRIVFITDDDAQVGANSVWSQISLVEATPEVIPFDFTYSVEVAYEDVTPTGEILDQGSQAWTQILGDFTITEDTRLTFDFSSEVEGEIHGIMFANGETLSEATTIQVFGSQSFGHSIGESYSMGSGGQSFDIAVGALFTGTFDRIVFITDDDSEIGANSQWANVVLVDRKDVDTGAVQFNAGGLSAFQLLKQDEGIASVSEDGQTLEQGSQSWRQLLGEFKITEHSRLKFDFSADVVGEIHGIMFTNGETLSRDSTIKLLGSQNFGHKAGEYYTPKSGVQSYDIAVGELFTGTFDRIVFITDDDEGVGANSTWSNVTLREVIEPQILSFSETDALGFQDGQQNFGEIAIVADTSTQQGDKTDADPDTDAVNAPTETPTVSKKISEDLEPQVLPADTGGDQPVVDAGDPPVVDAGDPPVADAGDPPVADAGDPPVVDAGDPPVVDAGDPPVVDAGDPPVEGGDGQPVIAGGDQPVVEAAEQPVEKTELLFTQGTRSDFLPGAQTFGSPSIVSGGSLVQGSQSWDQLSGPFDLTSESFLQFTFSAEVAGEIHGIMFTNGDVISVDTMISVLGSQEDTGIQVGDGYSAGSGAVTFDIPVGQFFTGSFEKIVFLTDDDAGVGAGSTWSNVSLREDPAALEAYVQQLEVKAAEEAAAEVEAQAVAEAAAQAAAEAAAAQAQAEAEAKLGSQSDVLDAVVGGDGVPEVVATRVTTLTPAGDDIASIEVVSKPEHGNLTVNPDGTLALVLTKTDYTGDLAFSYQVTRSDGTTEVVDASVKVTEGPLSGGWGEGTFYMLETDATGTVTVEHGDNHRDVFVSGSDSALSVADIAAREGVEESAINGRWLMERPEYGSSADMALADDAGALLWGQLMRATATEPASHWLQLEAGYSYEMGRLYDGMQGESSLHPIHITSYGEGDRPILNQKVESGGAGVTHLVFSDVAFGVGTGFNAGQNVLMDNITASGESHIVVQRVDGFTLRNSEIFDVARETSVTEEFWHDHKNKISGIYSGNTQHLLVENTLFDHNGWGENYSMEASLEYDQPPSIYSHNVYFSVSVSDVTFRDNVSMNGASFGAQFRNGAVVEDNAFIGNNSAFYVGRGVLAENSGEYSLALGNVVTHAGHHEYTYMLGHLGGGIGEYSHLTALVDNIVAHMADPNDPSDLAGKDQNDGGVLHAIHTVHDNTLVYNWHDNQEAQGTGDLLTAGLDTAVADQTTIQLYTAQLLGDPNATLDDLSLYLRERGAGAFDGVTDAELIVEFFRAGFGIEITERLVSETLRFVPDAKGDGVRWDNRLNWSTEDLPGSVSGDSVDLAGNWVLFGGNGEIANMELGAGGQLEVNNGRLDVTGAVSTGQGGQISVTHVGQLWLEDYADSDLLDVDVSAGRLAMTGDVTGALDLDVTGGQVLIAEGADVTLGDGASITVTGDDAKLGFDGKTGGAASLTLTDGATLRFEADETGLATLGEFRSGAMGDTTNVTSKINLNGKLQIDLTAIGSDPSNQVLLSADELEGAFDVLEVTGLEANRDARVVIDYEDDVVVLRLGTEGTGSGELNFSTVGAPPDFEAAPADVTLNGLAYDLF